MYRTDVGLAIDSITIACARHLYNVMMRSLVRGHRLSNNIVLTGILYAHRGRPELKVKLLRVRNGLRELYGCAPGQLIHASRGSPLVWGLEVAGSLRLSRLAPTAFGRGREAGGLCKQAHVSQCYSCK